MPLPPPTRQEYYRLCFRASVNHARDAVVAYLGHRYAAAQISCQHSWEMAGKTSLGIEAGYNWPPQGWMGSHYVMHSININCVRLVLPRRTQRVFNRLESWLPPGVRHANPPRNTEYIFDNGTVWAIPADHFTAAHARTSIRAIIRTLASVKEAYRNELKGLSAKVPNI